MLFLTLREDDHSRYRAKPVWKIFVSDSKCYLGPENTYISELDKVSLYFTNIFGFRESQEHDPSQNAWSRGEEGKHAIGYWSRTNSWAESLVTW